ncbi:MAG TPA: alpha/beta hydrolase [Conexibacter sp.]|nr:alpha/beta hydrolase [Conexibacter sp.]
MRPTVIFVHGVFIWDPDWWWRPVAERLREHGIESRTVQLPSTGPAAPLGDLRDDTAAVRHAIDAVGGPVVLVGHSYGGMVVNEAAAGHPLVSHLVFMSAFVPDGRCAVRCDFTNPDDMAAFDHEMAGGGPKAWIGSRLLKLRGGAVNALMLDWMIAGGLRARIATAVITFMARGGWVTSGEGGTKSHLLVDLPDPELVRGSLQRLVRQSVICGVQAPKAAAWREKPSTFIVILNDLDVSVERQRAHAARCDQVIELPTNHFAHLERPDLVCDALLQVAGQGA